MGELQHQIGANVQAAAEPLARVGNVITDGPIPANVVELRDSVRDWHERDGDRWHQGGIGNDGCPWTDEQLLRYAPLTVTKVREPEPADGACSSCLLPHGDGPCDLYGSQPVDLLDLVRQYGNERENAMTAGEHAGAAEVEQHEAAFRALYARITAEVERLRAERDSARGALTRLEVQRDEALAEVERLKSSAFVPSGLVQATDANWRTIAAERNEALAEVERLKAATLGGTEQARHIDGGLYWARERCGRIWLDEQRPEPSRCRPCDETEAWRPLLVATDTPQDGVLRLPEVPEGAVALVGGYTGHRYDVDPDGWRHRAEGWIADLGLILSREQGSVTVEMAPTREPRTWPKLDAPCDVGKVRGADGATWVRTDDGRWHGLSNGLERETFSDLQECDGPLTEVIE